MYLRQIVVPGSNPNYLVVDSRGWIALTDYGDHTVVILDSEGQIVTRFGAEGVGGRSFSYPDGIAIDHEGNLVVVCYESGMITRWDG